MMESDSESACNKEWNGKNKFGKVYKTRLKKLKANDKCYLNMNKK